MKRSRSKRMILSLNSNAHARWFFLSRPLIFFYPLHVLDDVLPIGHFSYLDFSNAIKVF
jgi:hypothetical protein